MYTISIWVPSKGWNQVSKVKSAVKAHSVAESFLPLEVKVTASRGHTYYAGRPCYPDYTMQENTNTLSSILN